MLALLTVSEAGTKGCGPRVFFVFFLFDVT